MKRSKEGRKNTSRKRNRHDTVEVVEDFSKELENLIKEEQAGCSDQECYSDLSAGSDLDLENVIDESLFDENFNSDEEDEDVGKREFVSAQLSEEEDEESDEDLQEETDPNPSPLTMEEIENLKQSINSKFDPRLASKAIGMLGTFLSSCKASSKVQSSVLELDQNVVIKALLQFVLVDLVELFDRELAVDNTTEPSTTELQSTTKSLAKLPGWKRISGSIEQALKVILNLLQTVLGSSSVLIVLNCCNQWLGYLECFPKIASEMAVALMDIWSGVVCSNYEDERVKVASALILCKMAKTNEALLGSILKGVYVRFAKSAKSVSIHNVAVVNFMLNSMLEVYRINPVLSYHYGFLFIRQLALSVRCLYSTGLASELREKQVKKVLSWQFLYCLKFWSKFVSLSAIKSEPQSSSSCDIIGQLTYPIVQICVCILNAGQRTKQQYFPYFLHIIRLLNELAIGRNVFVGIFNYAFSIIQSMNSNHALTKSDNLKPIDFGITLKVSKQFVNSRLYFDLLLEECTIAILESFSVPCLAQSPGFVEYGEVVRGKLAKCIKSAKNPKVSKFLGEIVEIVKGNQSYIQQQRVQPVEVENEKNQIAPLISYWASYKKTMEQKKRMEYETSKEK